MESKIIRSLVVLGVPGVALGIFFLLLRQFNFSFATIEPTLAAVIAILFLVIVGSVTFYAIHRWAPQNTLPDTSVLNIATDALNALHELDNVIRTTIGPLRQFDQEWSKEDRENTIRQMNALADTEIILPRVRQLIAELEGKEKDPQITAAGTSAIAAILKCGQTLLQSLGQSDETPWPGPHELGSLIDSIRSANNPEATSSIRESAQKFMTVVNRPLLREADKMAGRFRGRN
jgi:hypothetical protein